MKRLRTDSIDRETDTRSYSLTDTFEPYNPAQGKMDTQPTAPPHPLKVPPAPPPEAKTRAWPEAIGSLAALAEPEDWTGQNTTATAPYGILNNYIRYTYQRLVMENKITINTDYTHATFNTGLLTPLGEEIFGYFARNRSNAQPWVFEAWKKESDKTFMDKFLILPEMAEYAAVPADLVYDIHQPLTLNIEHIVQENRDRFPLSLRNERLPQMSLRAAKDVTLKRVRRNYKIAIPQWYPSSGGTRTQLLLPLDLTDSGAADVALVVSPTEGGGYRAHTILTLEMAYSNARLVARPNSDWLRPQVGNVDV